jgi:biopolymer transport protein ExbD
MKHLRGRKRRHKETAELNITAFMNLMVVLVPFLLITAVFSRLAVLELNLPNAQSQAQNEPPKPELQLEITVRENSIDVGDRNNGTMNHIDNVDSDYDLAKLSDYLRRVKGRFPDKADATLLLEPNIPYDVLVQVMDTVRVAEVVDDSTREVVRYELFPEISIGDAPILN